VRRRFSEAGRPFWQVFFASVAFIAAALALVASRPFFPLGLRTRSHFPDHWPLPHHSLKLGILSGIAVAVGLLALIGVWLVGAYI
jgi:hypothetical protein